MMSPIGKTLGGVMQSLASEAPLLIKNEGGPRCGNGSMSVMIPQLVHVCCHVLLGPYWGPSSPRVSTTRARTPPSSYGSGLRLTARRHVCLV